MHSLQEEKVKTQKKFWELELGVLRHNTKSMVQKRKKKFKNPDFTIETIGLSRWEPAEGTPTAHHADAHTHGPNKSQSSVVKTKPFSQKVDRKHEKACQWRGPQMAEGPTDSRGAHGRQMGPQTANGPTDGRGAHGQQRGPWEASTDVVSADPAGPSRCTSSGTAATQTGTPDAGGMSAHWRCEQKVAAFSPKHTPAVPLCS